jgi:hypothetical protein
MTYLATKVNVRFLLEVFFWIIEIIHVPGIVLASVVLTDLWYSQPQINLCYVLNNYTSTRSTYQCTVCTWVLMSL